MRKGDRLFVGKYPAGIVYADRYREACGDYLQVAFLSYATLKLDIHPTCPEDLVERIKADARQLQMRSGESYPITTSGQTVMLGSDLDDQGHNRTIMEAVCGDDDPADLQELAEREGWA